MISLCAPSRGTGDVPSTSLSLSGGGICEADAQRRQWRLCQRMAGKGVVKLWPTRLLMGEGYPSTIN